MNKVNFWVEYNGIYVRLHPRPVSGPDVYQVEVETDLPPDHLDVKTAAFRQAGRLRQKDLETRRSKHLSTTSKRPRSAPSTQVDWNLHGEDEQVFEPDEIMPFITELMPDLLSICQKPIRFELTGAIETAATDCKTHVMLNPEPFLNGEIRAGRGRAFHEGGHIIFSPQGGDLMIRSQKEDGPMVSHVLNLIVDRRDDDLNVAAHPGFARALWMRLGHIFPGPDGRLSGVPDEVKEQLFTDFAYACKKRTRPRHKIVRRCMRWVRRAIRRVNAGQRPYEHLRTIAVEVTQTLMEHETKAEKERREVETEFRDLMKQIHQAIHGQRADGETQQAFRQAMAQRQAQQRRSTLKTKLAASLNNPQRRSVSRPPPVQGGEIIHVQKDPAAYAAALSRVKQYVPTLRRVIEDLSVPETIFHRGQERGHLDFSRLAVLASGGSDCMMLPDEIIRLEVEMSFLLDISGSMSGRTDSQDLAVLMNEALLGNHDEVGAHFWAYHNDLFVCGPAAKNNGIASLKCDKANNDSFAIWEAGSSLLSSTKKHRLHFTVTDGGYAQPFQVEKTCQTLAKAGILTIAILVGVDTAPKTHEIELFFDSFPDVMKNLSSTFRQILTAARG